MRNRSYLHHVRLNKAQARISLCACALRRMCVVIRPRPFVRGSGYARITGRGRSAFMRAEMRADNG